MERPLPGVLFGCLTAPACGILFSTEKKAMIRNRAALEAFEEEQVRNSPADYWKNLRIFEALYEEARSLGVFPLKDPLDGIEADIHLARALNALPSSRPCRRRS